MSVFVELPRSLYLSDFESDVHQAAARGCTYTEFYEDGVCWIRQKLDKLDHFSLDKAIEVITKGGRVRGYQCFALMSVDTYNSEVPLYLTGAQYHTYVDEETYEVHTHTWESYLQTPGVVCSVDGVNFMAIILSHSTLAMPLTECVQLEADTLGITLLNKDEWKAHVPIEVI